MAIMRINKKRERKIQRPHSPVKVKIPCSCLKHYLNVTELNSTICVYTSAFLQAFGFMLNMYFNVICTRMKLEPLANSLCNMLVIKYMGLCSCVLKKARFELAPQVILMRLY
jgi:hypothetical protein